MPAGAVAVYSWVEDRNDTMARSERPGAEPACSCQPVIPAVFMPDAQLKATVKWVTVAMKFVGAAGGGNATSTDTSLDGGPGIEPYLARTRTKYCPFGAVTP